MNRNTQAKMVKRHQDPEYYAKNLEVLKKATAVMKSKSTADRRRAALRGIKCKANISAS